jgi:hypothetical protein
MKIKTKTLIALMLMPLLVFAQNNSDFDDDLRIDMGGAVSIEPALSFSTPQRNTSSLYSYNINPMLSLGIYGRYKRRLVGSRSKYKYSQIGVKVDYLHNGISMRTSSGFREHDVYDKQSSYVNLQLSWIANKFFEVDLGMIPVIDDQNFFYNKAIFNGTVGVYLPIKKFRLGCYGRVLTDFEQGLSGQYGVSLKYDLFK